MTILKKTVKAGPDKFISGPVLKLAKVREWKADKHHSFQRRELSPQSLKDSALSTHRSHLEEGGAGDHLRSGSKDCHS